MMIETMTLSTPTPYRYYGLGPPLAHSAAADAATQQQQQQQQQQDQSGLRINGKLVEDLSDITKAVPKIQDQLSALIEDRLAQFRRNNPVADVKEKEELERLRVEKSEREKAELERKGEYDKVVSSIRESHASELSERQKSIDTLMNEIRQDRCVSALVVEATKAGAIDPQDIADLLARRMTLDKERRPVVLDEKGEPWFKAGKAMSVKDLIEKHMHDRPWMYKAETQGDASGAHGTGHSTSDSGGASPTELDKEIKTAEEALEAARTTAFKSRSPGDIEASKVAAAKVKELKDKKKAAKT